jgi:PIN domain nuclease of toxin-antitoxin system
MRVLLDTHAWLWFVLGDPSLGRAARSTIEDPAAQKLVSPASYWEVAIK